MLPAQQPPLHSIVYTTDEARVIQPPAISDDITTTSTASTAISVGINIAKIT
jgi:hypothetical protein